jgi:hypothetical protein
MYFKGANPPRQLADLHTTAKSMVPSLAPHLLPSTVARLESLQPVVSEEAARAADETAAAGTLAEMPGESAAERQARIQRAAQGATDISGLVKPRKKAPAVAQEGAVHANGNGSNGKRKLEDDDDVVSEKKVRFGE